MKTICVALEYTKKFEANSQKKAKSDSGRKVSFEQTVSIALIEPMLPRTWRAKKP